MRIKAASWCTNQRLRLTRSGFPYVPHPNKRRPIPSCDRTTDPVPLPSRRACSVGSTRTPHPYTAPNAAYRVRGPGCGHTPRAPPNAAAWFSVRIFRSSTLPATILRLPFPRHVRYAGRKYPEIHSLAPAWPPPLCAVPRARVWGLRHSRTSQTTDGPSQKGSGSLESRRVAPRPAFRSLQPF
ncbi:hypothetical protein OH76DRAFT_1039899 [Lentinus brumalis]|uniref:Uncharacterized protein n=1 Tax=Lentinus brumalis TaxID=2498619 RepID=A0A371CWZ7_9APHY|nr:hypothetical protein OH76DRAFT_1039899 [Polyporus brumalis]